MIKTKTDFFISSDFCSDPQQRKSVVTCSFFFDEDDAFYAITWPIQNWPGIALITHLSRSALLHINAKSPFKCVVKPAHIMKEHLIQNLYGNVPAVV